MQFPLHEGDLTYSDVHVFRRLTTLLPTKACLYEQQLLSEYSVWFRFSPRRRPPPRLRESPVNALFINPRSRESSVNALFEDAPCVFVL